MRKGASGDYAQIGSSGYGAKIGSSEYSRRGGRQILTTWKEMEQKLTAQDLQIGDWVVYNGDVEYSTPIKVEAMDIATDSLITSDRDDVGFDGVWPIPITPEILKNNGFENVVETCYRYVLEEIGHCEAVRVYTYEEPIIVVRVIDGNEFKGRIKYVHQLQQAMRLCGIKKSIIL